MSRWSFVVPLILSLSAPALAEGWSQTDVLADQVKSNSAPLVLGQTAAGEEVSPDDAALFMAQDATLAIFYHEMGHALIDILQAPVLGLEEDAADVLSALLINELWDEAASEEKLRAITAFWAASMAEEQSVGEMPLNYGVHSPNDRRYFTFVCLWYGASPDTREKVAIELGLPEERAVTCPDEFDLANRSWGPFLDTLYENGAGTSLVWKGPDPETDAFAAVLKEEVDYLNSVMSLPQDLTVNLAACGETNAFYDPSETAVTICTEITDWVLAVAQGG
jgi:hypothetical protein